MATSTRPTVAPTFNPEDYARESEAKLRRAAAREEALDVYESAVVPAAPRAARISLEGVPKLRVALSELRAMTLDHRAGFLLSLCDGSSSVETILDMCAMPRDEAVAILSDLVMRGVVALG